MGNRSKVGRVSTTEHLSDVSDECFSAQEATVHARPFSSTSILNGLFLILKNIDSTSEHTMPGNLQTIPASVLESWPTPNYLDPYRRTGIVPLAIVLQAAATLMVVARLVLRARQQAGPLGFDDVREFGKVDGVRLLIEPGAAYTCMAGRHNVHNGPPHQQHALWHRSSYLGCSSSGLLVTGVDGVAFRTGLSDLDMLYQGVNTSLLPTPSAWNLQQAVEVRDYWRNHSHVCILPRFCSSAHLQLPAHRGLLDVVQPHIHGGL